MGHSMGEMMERVVVSKPIAETLQEAAGPALQAVSVVGAVIRYRTTTTTTTTIVTTTTRYVNGVPFDRLRQGSMFNVGGGGVGGGGGGAVLRVYACA